MPVGQKSIWISEGTHTELKIEAARKKIDIRILAEKLIKEGLKK